MKILLPLIIALAAVPAYAQLYKWTDASGKVHYSDRPLDGANSKEVAVNRTPKKAAAATAPGADDWRERERESREQRIKREALEKDGSATAARNGQRAPYNPSANRTNKPMSDDEVCKRDAQQIEFSEKVPQLGFRGAGGSVAVSEEERQAIVRQRKENHALLCGSGQRTH
jgi:hypothetical protein